MRELSAKYIWPTLYSSTFARAGVAKSLQKILSHSSYPTWISWQN